LRDRGRDGKHRELDLLHVGGLMGNEPHSVGRIRALDDPHRPVRA
jgi:hypothetical protein